MLGLHSRSSYRNQKKAAEKQQMQQQQSEKVFRLCIPVPLQTTEKLRWYHGNLGKMLLEEETECFCFLAGHESFAAAEGAIGIAEKKQTKVRQKPLRVILNGLGKTLHRLSPVSTDSHLLRQRWITQRMN